MRTPIQEVYENFNKMSDRDFKAWMLNTDLLEKEKEMMCGFGENVRGAMLKSDKHRTTEEVYNETFNTKEK